MMIVFAAHKPFRATKVDKVGGARDPVVVDVNVRVRGSVLVC